MPRSFFEVMNYVNYSSARLFVRVYVRHLFSFGLLVLTIGSVHADHEFEYSCNAQPYCVSSTFNIPLTYGTPQEQCAKYGNERLPRDTSWTSVTAVRVIDLGNDQFSCETDYRTASLQPDDEDRTFSFGLARRIAEHEEPETCMARAGETIQISFVIDTDGPQELPDIGCQNNCALDGSLDVHSEFDQFGQHVSDLFTGTLTYNGSDCPTDTPPLLPPEVETDNPEPPPVCTANYYTSPETGQIVCGTPPTTTTDDNGTQTTSQELPDGSQQTTTTTPDGTQTTTTEHPDGSTQTTTTTPDGQTTQEFTQSENNDNSEPDACPSNMFQLVNGQLVCEGSETSAENTEFDDSDIVNSIEEGNSTLDEILDAVNGDPLADNPTSFDFESMDAQIEAAREEFNVAVNNIGSAFGNMASAQLAHRDYTCTRSVTVIGITIPLCITPIMLDALNLLGVVVLLIAHFEAIRIVMSV